MTEFVMAVDGGNSKTDVALVSERGELVAHVRGAGCSPHKIGTDACVELIDELFHRACAQAQLDFARPAAAVLLVAGADLESEEEELRGSASRRTWADALEVGNDTLAVLRAGSDSCVGVAVTCGAGINAVGRAPDGRRARFPALGAITGDWGGGSDLGLAALGKAVRADDGRGRPTVLAQLVPAHFSLQSGEQVALAVHRRELDHARLAELAPLTLQAADAGDVPAIELRARLAREVVAFVRAAAARVLDGLDRYDVVLGGSVLARSESLAREVIVRLREELPAADPCVSTLPPVVGSALLGLDLIGARHDAHERLRAQARGAFSADGWDALAGDGAGASSSAVARRERGAA
jgi:N-acetylglucosamine kinase-like BadF-type ATPase